MNILFVQGKYPNIGGVEIVSTILANHFIKHNHKVVFVSFEQPLLKISPELNENIKQYKLSYPVLSLENFKILNKVITDHKINFILNQW